jgi:hypothetical protein
MFELRQLETNIEIKKREAKWENKDCLSRTSRSRPNSTVPHKGLVMRPMISHPHRQRETWKLVHFFSFSEPKACRKSSEHAESPARRAESAKNPASMQKVQCQHARSPASVQLVQPACRKSGQHAESVASIRKVQQAWTAYTDSRFRSGLLTALVSVSEFRMRCLCGRKSGGTRARCYLP